MNFFLKELIYPNKCMLCQVLLEVGVQGQLCNQCYKSVLRHNLCSKCGRPYNIGAAACVYCTKEEPAAAAQIVALFPYEGTFRKAVFRWKYKGLRKYAKGYADLFVNDLWIIDKLKIDALVPVPIAKARFRKRGFNQALDLSCEISKLTEVKVYDILTRTRETKAQSKCSKKERLHNIKGSIKVKEEVTAVTLNHIAIIDDIYTTGATVKACIQAINRHKIIENAKIYVLTVCIGV